MEEPKKLNAYEKKLRRREYEKSLKHYRKTEIVDLLCGVLDIPRDQISDVFSALCDLLVELSFTESIVHLPKFGRFIFEPKAQRRIWNPKEQRALIYQNPSVGFKVGSKLRSLLRKQYRRNCYQLAELNKVPNGQFKPPEKWNRKEETTEE